MNPSNLLQKATDRPNALRNLAAVGFVFILTLIGLLGAREVCLDLNGYDLLQDRKLHIISKPPKRGRILDRKGRLLAGNRESRVLIVKPDYVENIDATLEGLADIITIDQKDINQFRQLISRRHPFEFELPLRFDLHKDEIASFESNKHRFPGVEIKLDFVVREYPIKNITAHVIGYVGPVNETELTALEATDAIGVKFTGKNGVEKAYEDELRGRMGYEYVETNAQGSVVRTLGTIEPIPGQELWTNLDASLQRFAQNALGSERGAVVAIEPESGSVLAMVSTPSYDPNPFVTGIDVDEYSSLVADPSKPLYNRALRGQYPPGSTITPFLALAGLNYEMIYWDSRVFCPGFFQLPGSSHRYRDWKRGGHGSMDLDSAIAQSCDVFFYKLASELGVDRIHDFLSHFGFGTTTGIDLTGEASGLLPSREWKRRSMRQPWYPGETLIFGIGQGYFLATPLQLAAATAAIANSGKYYKPQIVRISEKFNEVSSSGYVERRSIPVDTDMHWRDIRNAMQHAVENDNGTAKQIHTDVYAIAGKTGVAQVFSAPPDLEEDEEILEKLRDHSLFIAYAPVIKPEIAIAVILENGGSAGSSAQIGRKVLDHYLLCRSETISARPGNCLSE